MKVYMIRHNPTGLYYVSTARKSYGSGLNIQSGGMIYVHKPSVRYFFEYGETKTKIKNRVTDKHINVKSDEFEIVEYEMKEI